MYKFKKKVVLTRFRKRGPDQIRTGVEAFAELCLAARPQDRNSKNKLFFTFFFRIFFFNILMTQS